MGELSHLVGALLTTTVGSAPTPPATTPPAQPLQVDLIPDWLAILSEAVTAAAIVIGGIFAYFKFVKGRVLSAALGLELKACMAPHPEPRRSGLRRRFVGPSASALLVEVAIRNNGQLPLTVPRNSEQLVSISSITEEELTLVGPGLSQGPMSWKRPDAYFARANILLDNGQQPSSDLKLGSGDVIALATVFPVPNRHHAAAFLVVVNAYAESRRRFRRTVKTPETRTLVLPRQRRS